MALRVGIRDLWLKSRHSANRRPGAYNNPCPCPRAARYLEHQKRCGTKRSSMRSGRVKLHRPSHGGLQQQGLLVEKKIKGGDLAVPCDDEISSGVSWRLPRATRYPLKASGIPQF